MFLVDTNVISEVRKRERADKGVMAFFRKAAQDDADLYLSVVTVGELRRGVEIIRHRGDKSQATRLENWLDGVLREFASNILGVDEEIGQLWGRLRVPHPEHSLDKLIAATALIHDLIVVTRNVDDFAGTGARVLNPFES
ncbi:MULTISPECIES: type II toxin-antitoxin system VapC family toxin [Burkholderia]|uniref:type II toxin-antitoxin system VapC family toxin n=1 Tax=Burkholderia TaxID=32008 RepID=UPI00075F0740|nr:MULTISPECIES: type II toxin-antitoxin system VapC family toxin [Burkholderia]AOK09399.1 DNA-binding protein [Burkholderia vietnamiensis]KVR97968.1 DNA-binding protein [Burkholderia vietnamiensis]MBR7913370.1 type II toxin-antitoxin system VapC family toxin [Burkholderia vietnamiensis]MBR8035524.1 type II toxin-antitoxin system VapC family toxin [Burkholderia vietnamiensis]MBR8084765.1 type II toxin-antitoxin system VapC family toxin [Burkholderia vietnamiensis]